MEEDEQTAYKPMKLLHEYIVTKYMKGKFVKRLNYIYPETLNTIILLFLGNILLKFDICNENDKDKIGSLIKN